MKNEKLKLTWALACKSSAVDHISNLLSIFEVAEEFTVGMQVEKDSIPEKLNLPINFQIIMMWEKVIGQNEESADIKLEFIDPNNKKLGEFSNILVIPADKKRVRNVVNINGIGATTPGTYLFRIVKREDEKGLFVIVGEISIDIKINKIVKKQDFPTVKRAN